MDQQLDPILRGSLDWYKSLLGSCTLSLDPHKSQILDNTCDLIVDNKLRFAAVELVTKVPWWLVGAWQYREKDVTPLGFHFYLGNGDPLNQRTVNVPAGRGPFSSWETGAIDAIEHEGLSGKTDWTIEEALYRSERWNGLGYFEYHPTVLDPYLWSFTNLYTAGKYGSDGHFNAGLVDQQAGVGAIIKELQSRGVV